MLFELSDLRHDFGVIRGARVQNASPIVDGLPPPSSFGEGRAREGAGNLQREVIRLFGIHLEIAKDPQ